MGLSMHAPENYINSTEKTSSHCEGRVQTSVYQGPRTLRTNYFWFLFYFFCTIQVVKANIWNAKISFIQTQIEYLKWTNCCLEFWVSMNEKQTERSPSLFGFQTFKVVRGSVKIVRVSPQLRPSSSGDASWTPSRVNSPPPWWCAWWPR